MGNGSTGEGYRPLSYFDRLKIRAATKHLHSRYISVRHAAHKEIERILHRRRQSLRARISPRRWARQAWERINYGKLNKCGNCDHATRDKDMFRHHVNSHMRDTARSQESAAPTGRRHRRQDPNGTSRRNRDMRQQPGRLRDYGSQAPVAHSPAGPVTNSTLRQAARAPRPPPAPGAAPRTAAAAPKPGPVRTPPLPSATIRPPRPRTPKPRLRIPRLRART
jgi:hypothetical protein